MLRGNSIKKTAQVVDTLVDAQSLPLMSANGRERHADGARIKVSGLTMNADLLNTNPSGQRRAKAPVQPERARRRHNKSFKLVGWDFAVARMCEEKRSSGEDVLSSASS